jgi:hypothetical protein
MQLLTCVKTTIFLCIMGVMSVAVPVGPLDFGVIANFWVYGFCKEDFQPLGIFTRGYLKLRENRGVISDSASLLTEDSRHPRVELVNKATLFEVPDVDGARKSLDTFTLS